MYVNLKCIDEIYYFWQLLKLLITVLYEGNAKKSLKPVCKSEIVIFTFYIEQKL